MRHIKKVKNHCLRGILECNKMYLIPSNCYYGFGCIHMNQLVKISNVNVQVCAFWREWGEWSECSTTCGSNVTRSRFRICANGAVGDDGCVGPGSETAECELLVKYIVPYNDNNNVFGGKIKPTVNLKTGCFDYSDLAVIISSV